MWNGEFTGSISTANLHGSYKNNKHKGSLGKYYGFGVIGTHEIKGYTMPIANFAGNSPKNSDMKELIPILKNNILYMIAKQQNMVPLSFYCGSF